MESTLTESSTIEADKDQLSADLTGEAVVLNTKSGVYYGLNAVGATVWDLVGEPKTVGGIGEALLEKYDVAPGWLRE